MPPHKGPPALPKLPLFALHLALLARRAEAVILGSGGKTGRGKGVTFEICVLRRDFIFASFS